MLSWSFSLTLEFLCERCWEILRLWKTVWRVPCLVSAHSQLKEDTQSQWVTVGDLCRKYIKNALYWKKQKLLCCTWWPLSNAFLIYCLSKFAHFIACHPGDSLLKWPSTGLRPCDWACVWLADCSSPKCWRAHEWWAGMPAAGPCFSPRVLRRAWVCLAFLFPPPLAKDRDLFHMRLRPARRWTVGSSGQRVLSYVWLWNLDRLGFWKAKNITENCILWNCGWYVGPLSPPEILMGKALCGGMFRVNYVTVHWIFNSLMCVQLEIWKLWKSQSMVPTKKLVLGTLASCGREALRNPFRRSQFFHSAVKGSCSVGHQDPCRASLSVQCGNHQTAWQEIT